MNDPGEELGQMDHDELLEEVVRLRAEVERLRADKTSEYLQERLEAELLQVRAMGEHAARLLNWGKPVDACTTEGRPMNEMIPPIGGKPKQEALPPLAGPTQCGEWTQWGQCIAEKPCEAHTEKPKGERARCHETMASDFVCGEYLPCKVHPVEKRVDRCPKCGIPVDNVVHFCCRSE
jgi:hypothetical protein